MKIADSYLKISDSNREGEGSNKVYDDCSDQEVDEDNLNQILISESICDKNISNRNIELYSGGLSKEFKERNFKSFLSIMSKRKKNVQDT